MPERIFTTLPLNSQSKLKGHATHLKEPRPHWTALSTRCLVGKVMEFFRSLVLKDDSAQQLELAVALVNREAVKLNREYEAVARTLKRLEKIPITPGSPCD